MEFEVTPPNGALLALCAGVAHMGYLIATAGEERGLSLTLVLGVTILAAWTGVAYFALSAVQAAKFGVSEPLFGFSIRGCVIALASILALTQFVILQVLAANLRDHNDTAGSGNQLASLSFIPLIGFPLIAYLAMPG